MNAPGSVLVVDDDGDVRALVVELLTRSGYDVSEAPNGREALKLLYEQRPDLVLLDISMPELDGWATLGISRSFLSSTWMCWSMNAYSAPGR